MTCEHGRPGFPPFPAPSTPCCHSRVQSGSLQPAESWAHGWNWRSAPPSRNPKLRGVVTCRFCICPPAQVLLAKHKSDGMFYAVKVLQKKSILKKKEVPGLGPRHLLSCLLTPSLRWLPVMGPTLSIEVVQLRGAGWDAGPSPGRQANRLAWWACRWPRPSPLPSPEDPGLHGEPVFSPVSASLPTCAMWGSHFRLTKGPSGHSLPGVLDASTDLSLSNANSIRTEQASRKDGMLSPRTQERELRLKKELTGQVLVKEAASKIGFDDLKRGVQAGEQEQRPGCAYACLLFSESLSLELI